MAPLRVSTTKSEWLPDDLRLSYLQGYGNCPLSQLGTTPGTRIAPQILLRRPKGNSIDSRSARGSMRVKAGSWPVDCRGRRRRGCGGGQADPGQPCPGIVEPWVFGERAGHLLCRPEVRAFLPLFPVQSNRGDAGDWQH